MLHHGAATAKGGITEAGRSATEASDTEKCLGQTTIQQVAKAAMPLHGRWDVVHADEGVSRRDNFSLHIAHSLRAESDRLVMIGCSADHGMMHMVMNGIGFTARQNERQSKVSREEMVVCAKRNAVTLHPVTHNSLARGKAMTPTQDTGMPRVIRGNAVAAVRLTDRHSVRRVCRVDEPRRRLIRDWRRVRLGSHLAMVSLREKRPVRLFDTSLNWIEILELTERVLDSDQGTTGIEVRVMEGLQYAR